MCVCVRACVCACTPAGAEGTDRATQQPPTPGPSHGHTEGLLWSAAGQASPETQPATLDAPRGPLGRRLPLPRPRCCRSLHKRRCCHGGHLRQCPQPTLPWQSSTSADVQSRPRHRKVTENLCGEGPQLRLGFMKFPMGSELGKKLRSHPSRILAVVTNLGQKGVCWAISAGLPKVLPATNLFLIFCNHLCSCISWKAAMSLETSLCYASVCSSVPCLGTTKMWRDGH